jgi:8-oxo-dGTP diphosphatase
MSQLPRHVLAVTGFVTNDEGRTCSSGWPPRGWEMPGGQVEEGEKPPPALRREIEEEAG